MKRLALVLVDNLMMPRELLDDAKRRASAATGIREEHMLIAATHSHSAPSVMGALGSRCDETYAAFLPDRLVSASGRPMPAACPPAWAGPP